MKRNKKLRNTMLFTTQATKSPEPVGNYEKRESLKSDLGMDSPSQYAGHRQSTYSCGQSTRISNFTEVGSEYAPSRLSRMN